MFFFNNYEHIEGGILSNNNAVIASQDNCWGDPNDLLLRDKIVIGIAFAATYSRTSIEGAQSISKSAETTTRWLMANEHIANDGRTYNHDRQVQLETPIIRDINSILRHGIDVTVAVLPVKSHTV